MAILLQPLAFLDIFSGPELILILAVVLIFFGGDKMPEFARGLAKTMREFKKAASDVEREIKRVIEEADQPPASPSLPAITLAPPEHLPTSYEPHYECPEDAAGAGSTNPDHPAAPAAEEPPGAGRTDPKPPHVPEL